METVMIDVTADHIANGKPNDGCKCPVALAIAEAFPGSDPSVSAQEVEMEIDGFIRLLDLPAKLEHIIDTYDEFGTMKPFTFYLEIGDLD